MDFQAITVDGFPIDEQLTDAGTVGPETAHLARVYLGTPRALVWRNPSSDWRLFVLLVPLASRLSLMRNPIFGALVRDWGLSVRFLGIDAHARAFDFRRLLTDATLRRLVDALTVWLSREPGHANEALDVLFAALADSMLTILEERRPDWPQHLARTLRLETNAADSLFDRQARYPDFLASLRGALKDDTIDVELYGRALRAIDLREESAERRVAALVESTLDAGTLDALRRLRTGLHLGCYNWVVDSPRHAAQRVYALTRLPLLAQAFVDSIDQPELARALDSGQDRAIVAALAHRFRVSENTVRAVWHRPPEGMGVPPTWHLAHILQRLDALAQRDWPRDAPSWQDFAQRAVPG